MGPFWIFLDIQYGTPFFQNLGGFCLPPAFVLEKIYSIWIFPVWSKSIFPVWMHMQKRIRGLCISRKISSCVSASVLKKKIWNVSNVVATKMQILQNASKSSKDTRPANIQVLYISSSNFQYGSSHPYWKENTEKYISSTDATCLTGNSRYIQAPYPVRGCYQPKCVSCPLS